MNIVLKVIIGLFVYFGLLTLLCLFMKGATKLGNEYDEQMEAERILKQLKEEEGKE